MGTIADKLNYLEITKTKIAEALEEKGQSVEAADPFRSYADKISAISGGNAKIPMIISSACFETSSGTSLTGTIQANAGDMLLITAVSRSSDTVRITPDPGAIWDLTNLDPTDWNQRAHIARYTVPTTGTQSVTIETYSAAQRIYLNLIVLRNVARINWRPDYAVASTTVSVTSITAPKVKTPNTYLIWICHAPIWRTAPSPYGAWTSSNSTHQYIGLDQTATQPRLANFIDFLSTAQDTTLPTFTVPVSTTCGIAAVEIIPQASDPPTTDWYPVGTTLLWEDFTAAPQIATSPYSVHDYNGNIVNTRTQANVFDAPCMTFINATTAQPRYIRLHSPANPTHFANNNAFIAFWFNGVAAASMWCRLINMGVSYGGNFAYIGIEASASGNFHVNTSNIPSRTCDGCVISTDYYWHNLICTYQENAFTIYVDGIAYCTLDLTGYTITLFDISHYLYCFNGYIGQIVYGSGKLSDDDIGKILAHNLSNKATYIKHTN